MPVVGKTSSTSVVTSASWQFRTTFFCVVVFARLKLLISIHFSPPLPKFACTEDLRSSKVVGMRDGEINPLDQKHTLLCHCVRVTQLFIAQLKVVMYSDRSEARQKLEATLLPWCNARTDSKGDRKSCPTYLTIVFNVLEVPLLSEFPLSGRSMGSSTRLLLPSAKNALFGPVTYRIVHHGVPTPQNQQ